MASEKKVSPKTWRIWAKNDARSTPFGHFSWYVLYVALHEVYNFTSGLLLKYIYKIYRV